jgi:predicted nucleic acid-binding protein
VILVDSSVGVDFFRPSPGRGGAELRRMIEESEPFALSGIVVAEVWQGLTRDAGVIERFLTQWEMLEPGGFDTYGSAAAIYRAGRKKVSRPARLMRSSQRLRWNTVPAFLHSIGILCESHA